MVSGVHVVVFVGWVPASYLEVSKRRSTISLQSLTSSHSVNSSHSLHSSHSNGSVSKVQSQ